MKKIALLFLFVFPPILLSPCSCEWKTLCAVLNGNEDGLVIKAVIDRKWNYGEDQAVSFDILTTYRDDFNIGYKKMKLFGSKWESYCDIDVLLHFDFNDTFYVSFMYLEPLEPGINPDSLYDQDKYVFRGHLCGMELIKPYSDDMLYGNISGENGGLDAVRWYPKALFESSLEHCDFSNEVLKSYNCSNSDYTIFPNPVMDNYFMVNTKTRFYAFDRIEIYHYHGRLAKVVDNLDYTILKGFSVSDLQKGYYIFRIFCGDRSVVQKVAVF